MSERGIPGRSTYGMEPAESTRGFSPSCSTRRGQPLFVAVGECAERPRVAVDALLISLRRSVQQWLRNPQWPSARARPSLAPCPSYAPLTFPLAALNYWRYSPSDGYDLTRGSSGPHATLQATTGPVMIDPKQTALIVVDMQCVRAHTTPDLANIVSRQKLFLAPGHPLASHRTRRSASLDRPCDPGVSRKRYTRHLLELGTDGSRFAAHAADDRQRV